MNELRDNKPSTVVKIAADSDVMKYSGCWAGKGEASCSFTISEGSLETLLHYVRGPDWKKGHNILNRDRPIELLLPEDNADALKVICAVIHHRNNKVPQTLAAGDVLGVAVTADNFRKPCTSSDLALIFAMPLSSNLEFCLDRSGDIAGVLGESAMSIPLLTAAAYLFQNAQAFKEITRELILNHDGPYLALSCEEVESAITWRVFCLLEG
ncbi:hypothetical protein IFR05_017123 [Cadophora sp. M221]|nr:hypothetical protein IFR05_017123 [Cadophora sp. M221]